MVGSSFYQRLGSFLDMVESRWSLAAHGAALIASFGIPAWATWEANLFPTYSPLSWVIAGFAGVLAWVVIRFIWSISIRIRVNAKYDAQAIEHSADFNPLDLTFERKRIFIGDFVLPSHPIIDGKTFIECDLIGPATIYFHGNNQAALIRPPKFDAVWLAPNATINNAFTFTNCIFRDCSFQRITMLASIENYEAWKDNPNVNWLSIAPSAEHIEERRKILREELARQGLPIPPHLAETKNN